MSDSTGVTAFAFQYLEDAATPQARWGGECTTCGLYVTEDLTASDIAFVDKTSSITWAGAVNLTVAAAAAITTSLMF